jgi:hypothetical protein
MKLTLFGSYKDSEHCLKLSIKRNQLFEVQGHIHPTALVVLLQRLHVSIQESFSTMYMQVFTLIK